MSNQPAKSDQFLIAALGASAGGLEALEKFFEIMPPDAGIAFVVVMHLSPDHASALPKLLARCTQMAVEQAQDKTKIVPNRVYIIPPNATLTVKDCILHVTEPVEPRGRRMAIDSLFRSLAEDRGECGVCIILSGTGTDGTLGLRAVKEHGGMAMAQTLDSARYDAILRSAIATGLVDHVLPVEEMPARLTEYAAHLNSVNGDGVSATLREQTKGKIYALLERRAGHDFSQYKGNTFLRRLERRMKALQIESAEQYVQLLEREPKEADQLFKDLLIGVTQFFRDPEEFETLGREVIPKLFEGKDAGGQVRVCVVGCASGEEAYSIAILLCEHAATVANPPKLKIFATDIDERGLEAARKGRYPESMAEHISAERLERFFIKQDNAYQVKRDLREICIFSSHSFIKDPPFSRLDLISCRNVMIYLGLDLQQKIIPLFHYALRRGGYLFLGPSENASSHRELFRSLDTKHRIFQRKESLPRPAVQFPIAEGGHRLRRAESTPALEGQNLPKQLERVILKRHGPACVIVKENGEALYYSGRINRYLEQPTGTPETNVVNLAREGIRIALRASLHQAVNTGERAVQKHVPVQINGGVSQVDITVDPLTEFQEASLFMIVFEEAPPATTAQHTELAQAGAGSEEIIRHLESELRTAQEHAQTAFEELETSNEELRSANEEFQSTNEELETSQEELQSFNEELETVNAELNRKVAELDHANSDLQNVLNSTQIATIFLDSEMHIRNFTPAAVSMFHLIASDVGRPITDFAAQFAAEGLVDDIQEVLRTLAARERDLSGTDERHHLMRILPYRTVHNVIDGVVITFTDVTLIKQAERLAQDARAYAENIIRTVREPLVVLNADLQVQAANESFYEVFQVSPNDTLNRSLFELGERQWKIPELQRLLGELLPEKKNLKDFQVEHEFPKIGHKTMLLNARQIQQQNGNTPLLLLAIEDITERRLAEQAIVSLKDELATDLAGMRRLHEISIRLVGHGDLQALLEEILDAAIEVTGAALGNIQLLNRSTGTLHIMVQRGFGQEFLDFFNSVHEGMAAACGTALHEGRRVIVEDVANDSIFKGTRAGEVLVKAGALAVQSTPLLTRSGEPLGVFSTHYRSPQRPNTHDLQRVDLLARHAADLIERKQAEEALRQSEERLAKELAATQQLQSLSALLIEGGATDTLDQKIMDAGVTIMHSDMASIHTVDVDRDALRLLAWRGFAPGFEEIFRWCQRDMETACSAARRAGHRVVVADVENCDFIKSAAALENHRRTGIRAVQSTPLFSRSGRLLGMLSTHWRTPYTPEDSDLRLFDILARQAADLIERRQTEESRGRLVALVQSSADAIISKDLDGMIRSWNPGAQRLFGYTAEEAIGQPITILIPADRADEEPAILARVRAGECIEHYDTIRRRKDGTLVDISLTVSPVFDEHGRIVAASKIARDITDRKRAEQQRRELEKGERALAVAAALRDTEAELARVSRALTVGELTTSIAHEVNQPLAGIVTNAEACLRWLQAKTPNLHEAEESLALIVRDGNRASEVIRRIREFLKKENPKNLSLDINDVAEETVVLARDELKRRGILLRLELAAGLPKIRGDRIQLQQVILNLIMNGSDAMETVSEGARELRIMSRRSGTDSILFSVRDSGAGIKPEHMERMFDAFFSTKSNGMGMGLSISRTIIEAHGGRIWAEPGESAGLTVQFTLPAESQIPA